MIVTSSISWKLCLGLSSSHTATKYRLFCCWSDSALPQVAFDYQIIKQFALWGLRCWQLLVSKATWMQICQLSMGFSLPGQWKEPKCFAPVPVSQLAGTGCHESTVCRHRPRSLHRSWGTARSHTPSREFAQIIHQVYAHFTMLWMKIHDSFKLS